MRLCSLRMAKTLSQKWIMNNITVILTCLKHFSIHLVTIVYDRQENLYNIYDDGLLLTLKNSFLSVTMNFILSVATQQAILNNA